MARWGGSVEIKYLENDCESIKNSVTYPSKILEPNLDPSHIWCFEIVQCEYKSWCDLKVDID